MKTRPLPLSTIHSDLLFYLDMYSIYLILLLFNIFAHYILVYLLSRYLSLLSACDRYNGMTKHNRAGMQNNLEPSQSFTQNNCSALGNEPIISINYNTIKYEPCPHSQQGKNKTCYIELAIIIIHNIVFCWIT